MSDIQATPAVDPAPAAPAVDAAVDATQAPSVSPGTDATAAPTPEVVVTATPADQGNAPASDASAAAPSSTDSASTASASTSEPAAPATDAPPAADAAPAADAGPGVSAPSAATDAIAAALPQDPTPDPTPAPIEPAITDAQMANAVASLEMLASLFAGMDFAMQALKQVSSLGQAINERQAKLADLDAAHSHAQIALAAVQGDVSRHTDAANSIVASALAHANQLRADADTHLHDSREQALADATAIRDSAVSEAAAMREAADKHVSRAQASVTQAKNDVGSIQALKDVLAGELADLETKVAIGRQNLRQLFGETK